MYITLEQLSEIPGATELAQVASSEHRAALVDPALMELTLRAGDTSAYSSDEIAAAEEAKARIDEAVTTCTETVDSYLARRVTIPRDPVPGILVRACRALVRYDLHKHLVGSDRDNPIVRDYRDAIRTLEQIRDGKITLGADDPISASESSLGDVRFESSAPVFARRNGVR